MTERIEHIINHIHFDSEEEVAKALGHAELLEDLTSEEKNDLTPEIGVLDFPLAFAGLIEDIRGISRVDQLKGRKPERLYRKLCDFKAGPVDKCMLYVFRCAVYYASTKEHDPNLLKWWNWKDRD